MTREDLLQPAASIWFQICPQCHQLWFIGAAQVDEPYRCKACGHDFIVGYDNQPQQTNERITELLRH